MNFEVIATGNFERKVKRLAKKYVSLKTDLVPILNLLAHTPLTGAPLGNNCYKIRIAITSKGKGKSGGARLITCIKVAKHTVYLVDLYDKSEQGTISERDLKLLIDLLA
jgi:hypothetical protein